MRLLIIFLMVLLIAGGVSAQTVTPAVSESIYATLTGGQVSRFDYVATASDVHIASLLTALFVSVWSIFFFVLFVVATRRRSK